MELEEMKTQWGEMSKEMEKQKQLTDSIITKMTQANFKNKIRSIVIPETIGALGCVVCSVIILLNFSLLNTWYLLGCGIISVLILMVLAIVSFRAICKIRYVRIRNTDFKQTLLNYSKGKLQFVFVQKLSFYLGAILLIVVLPVMGEIIAGKDIFKGTRIWFLYAIEFPFYYLFAKWVYKSYFKITRDAEDLLHELNN